MKIQIALLACIGLATLLVADRAVGQQGTKLEIVDQNGAPVRAQVIVVDDDQEEQKTGVTVKNEDGKITIIQSDGTKRVIDVSDAQSVIVNQSVKSIMKDGEKETLTFGKAIIVGPDGKRQEIELGGPIDGQLKLDVEAFGLPGSLPGTVRVRRNDSNKFMIGVNCTPISEAMRSQLRLDSGVGLLVEHVGTDTPASEAGIELHDILMYADDGQLTEISDLVDAVQKAGKDESKMALTVVRAGKEIGIDVTPRERPESGQLSWPGVFKVFPQLQGDQLDLQMQQLGPGVIIGKKNLQQDMDEIQSKMQQQMEELQAEMQRMQEMLRQRRDK
jgi:serine protease Do